MELTAHRSVKTGNPEEDPEGVASESAAVRAQGHQESSSVLREEVATMQVHLAHWSTLTLVLTSWW